MGGVEGMVDAAGVAVAATGVHVAVVEVGKGEFAGCGGGKAEA